jgi:hypothetical protein
MNTSNNTSGSHFFNLTEGVAKKGAAVFGNRVTLPNSPFIGLAGIASIPIFAVTLLCDVVIGLKRCISEKISPLSQRNVRIAPFPQDFASSKILLRKNPELMLKYLLTGDIKTNKYTNTFNTITKKNQVDEHTKFLKDFYIFSEKPTVKEAKNIQKKYLNTNSLNFINISSSLALKVNTSINSKPFNPEAIQLNLQKVKEEVVKMLGASLKDLYIQFPELGLDKGTQKLESKNSANGIAKSDFKNFSPPPVPSASPTPAPPVPSTSSIPPPPVPVEFLSPLSTQLLSPASISSLDSPLTKQLLPGAISDSDSDRSIISNSPTSSVISNSSDDSISDADNLVKIHTDKLKDHHEKN